MNRLTSIMVLAALLLALMGLALPASPAAAQNTGVQMRAAAAFGGYFKYGEWLPVWVELENQGSALNAEVRVSVSSSQGTIVYNTPVELPSGSRKLTPVYVLPNNFSRELDVQLIADDKVIQSAKVTVRPQANISYFVGLMAPERKALALLNGVEFTGQTRSIILVDLTTGDIPERAEGLRSFDLLILNDMDTSVMTPEQTSALSAWVQQGGRLVIGGGPGGQRTAAGLPESLLPVQVSGTGEVGQESIESLTGYAGGAAIEAAGPFAITRAVRTNGEIVLGNEAQPLVVERNIGSGAVVFVAFDLSGAPFNGWPGTQAFWEKLIGPSGSFPEGLPFDVSPRQFRANSLFYPLSNIPSLDLPSVRGLSILLAIYIIIVGPVNYLVLRSKKRLHLAWITIPILTVLFTGASFGIGYAMRGNDLVLNKIALVQTETGQAARVSSYMGLFSPRQQSYTILVDDRGGLVSPMSGYDSGGWGQPMTATGGEMVFTQSDPARVSGLTINQWSMQTFMAEVSWEDYGWLSGEFRIENDALVGKVRNETSYPMTDVVVTMQNRFTRLGDMAPGEEKLVDMGLANITSDRFGMPLSYRLYQEPTTGQMDRASELKVNILNSLLDNSYAMKMLSSSRFPASFGGVSANKVMVFGWMNQAPPDVEVQDSRISAQTTALVYTTMDYSFAKDNVLTLPPGLVPGYMTRSPIEGGSCGAAGSASVYMARGEAEFEFQAPEDVQEMQVDLLKVSIWRDSGGQMPLPEISVYEWEQEDWRVIQDPIQGVNLIQSAAAYVNEDGLVRVRVNATSDTFGCIYIDLGLEASSAAGRRGAK